SLERLRIFITPTCVGFSTVTLFVRRRLFLTPFPDTSGSYMPSSSGIFTPSERDFLSSRCLSAKRPDAFDRQESCRNINLPSIGYAFGPRLRGRLPLGGFTFPRKP